MTILSPGTQIGSYEIVSRPMIGGMGVVYFALDHADNGRPMALKTFKPEYLPDCAACDRFLALIDHHLTHWHSVCTALNRAPLAHEDWEY